MSSPARPVVVSPDVRRGGGAPASRTPPGQVLTRKWPVLHHGEVPSIHPAHWRLVVDGLVEHPLELGFEDLHRLPQVDLHCDIHCVTRWSRLDCTFTGVPIVRLLEMARPRPEARFVIQHASSAPHDGWTTNLPLADLLVEDALLAWAEAGAPLAPEHGAPVRAVVPRLYFWKGAKWIRRLELVADDRPGFWERNGYHLRGDPWREERYAW